MRKPLPSLWVWCILGACVGLLILGGGCDSEPADLSPTPTPTLLPHQRIGFGVSKLFGEIALYDVAQLHAGWYSDWDFAVNPPRPAGLEYVQLVRVGRDLPPVDQEALKQAIVANPGSIWIIGNEPERRAVQNPSLISHYPDLTPKEYAALYAEYYGLIKGLDPTARVAIGGVVQPSPTRLRWLELVLEEYQALTGSKMPVDIWNIHIQIMREKRDFPGCGDCWGADIPQGINIPEGMLFEISDNADIAILKDFVWTFRRWMKAQGEQEKPLIISEYGALMPSEFLGETKEAGDQVVIQFMRQSFDFFLHTTDPELGDPHDGYRLVQRWLWFSLNDPPFHYSEEHQAWIGFNGGLFEWPNEGWPGKLTPFGEAFAAYTSALLSTPTP